MDVGQQFKENRPSSVHTDNPETTFLTSNNPSSSLPLPIHDLPDNSSNSYIPLGYVHHGTNSNTNEFEHF